MWQRTLVETVVRYRYAVLILVALISAAAAFYALRLRFDSDMEIWFLEGDENLRAYKEFQQQFQADEIQVVAIFAEEVFTPELLASIDRITRDTEKLPKVHSVHSLTNAKTIDSRGAFHASVQQLIEELPSSQETAQVCRKRALNSALIRGNLVSEDGRASAIVVEIDPSLTMFEEKREFVEALKRIVTRSLPDGIEWHVAGTLSLEEAFFRYTRRDFSVLVPAGALAVIFLCVALLRGTRASWAPPVVVILAALWTFGLMGVLGLKINLISTSLMPLILAVGIADSIHVVSAYYQQLRAGKPRDEAVIHSTAGLVVPCFFTSATTAAGFLSILVSDLQPTREFGWLAAVGVFFAFGLSLTVLPSVLTLLPAPRLSAVQQGKDGPVDRFLGWLGRPTRRSSIVVLCGSALLVAAAAVSLPKLKVGANPMSYFRPEDPVRQSTYRVDTALGGSASLELVARTKPGGLKEPSILKRLAKLEGRLESLSGISHVHSALDSLREVRRVFTDGQPASATLPDTRPMAAQFYLVLENDEVLNRAVLGDYETMRLTARVKLSNTEQMSGRMDEFQAYLKSEFRDDRLWVDPTGYIILIDQMEVYLLKSQMRSLIIAFLVITVMMALLLRSVRLGLFSMIPNFAPIVIGLAFMAVTGIDLNPGTVMIGSMALGLVVDDTVHFLVRLRANLQQSNMQQAIQQTMRQTGRPIIITSVILAITFCTCALGSFIPSVFYGLVSAVVVLLALIADLVMLPAALLLTSPRRIALTPGRQR